MIVFRKLKGTLFVDEVTGKIRSKDRFCEVGVRCCPLNALLPNPIPGNNIYGIAEALKWELQLCEEIAEAADNAHDHDPWLRAVLLTLC